jgi:hypothetical protein
MNCGDTEIPIKLGLGFLGVLLEINLELMVLKEFLRPPMFLEAETAPLIGLIMKETFGFLVVIFMRSKYHHFNVSRNIHIVCWFVEFFFEDYYNDLWKFDGEEWTWVSGSNTSNQNGVYGQKGIPDPNNMPGSREFGVSWVDNNGNVWIFGGNGYPASGSTTGNAILITKSPTIII